MQELPIYHGQRYYREIAGLEQMATEAINTVKCLNYSLTLAAIKIYKKAAKGESLGRMVSRRRLLLGWNFRRCTHRAPEKQTKEKPLDGANIKRPALKRFPTTERKSL